MRAFTYTLTCLIACAALTEGQSLPPNQPGVLAKALNNKELSDLGLLPPSGWGFKIQGALEDGQMSSYVIHLFEPGSDRAILLRRYDATLHIEGDGRVRTPHDAHMPERTLLPNPRTKLHELVDDQLGAVYVCRGWAVDDHRGPEVRYSLLLDGLEAKFQRETVLLVAKQGKRYKIRKGNKSRVVSARAVTPELLRPPLDDPAKLPRDANPGVSHSLEGTSGGEPLAQSAAKLLEAKHKQQELACTNHLRHLALGAIMYGDDKRSLPSGEASDVIALLDAQGYLEPTHPTSCPTGAAYRGFPTPYVARTLSSNAPVVWCAAHVDEQGKPFVLVSHGDATTRRRTTGELETAIANYARR